MSLLSLSRAAHARIKDRFYRTGIVFHHVPKCGGTSVGRSLRKAYLLSQGTVTPEESFHAFCAVRDEKVSPELADGVFEFREMMLLYLLYSDVRCISAHIPFSTTAHGRFGDRYRFATILREPVDRFISHFLWSHNRPEGHAHIKEDLPEFVLTERAQAMGATYARYFCGAALSAKSVMAEGVARAVANLRKLDYVGFLDDMPAFESQLRLATGKRIRIGRENVGRQKEMHRRIRESDLLRTISDLCAPDREIWQAIQDLRVSPRGEA
jgi:hypothetical protein